ncbi:5-formyltetrahydrofolate cyclo-ligase [Salsipaludibacter albus]|uniref:5-formyltetrahydrofolate cyclo-ligase n=1 Tax=Salsipaludibacter albus TaxID=2849650 RepID=UPI001EE3FC40|nr:5-formyltetrahydrofolate cyclo-ligase [Salsipaludibacter albus]MBY5162698.1 5-formyltetrahydrofolate cyclo-ligase [Salsipaludibacter albus]
MTTPYPGPDADKSTLRAWARALAPATPVESRAVTIRLAASTWTARVRRACVYLAMPGEVDLADLPAQLPDVDWVTTRTTDDPLLTVHPLDAPRERHRFGFAQPVEGARRIDPSTVDVWLVPGLAFARTGDRLGNGAGYYDRLLAHAAPSATTVGVTLARRLVDTLPREPHDVVMDLVVHEDGTSGPG